MSKKPLVRLGFWVVVLALLVVLVGTFSLLQREVQALRVIPMQQDLSSLFGEEVTQYTPLGTKQGYIVLDEEAFFQEGDMMLLNQTYLQDQGLYPLQGRTVRIVQNVTLGMLLLLAVVRVFWRRMRTSRQLG